jgi:hypothetical protein
MTTGGPLPCVLPNHCIVDVEEISRFLLITRRERVVLCSGVFAKDANALCVNDSPYNCTPSASAMHSNHSFLLCASHEHLLSCLHTRNHPRSHCDRFDSRFLDLARTSIPYAGAMSDELLGEGTRRLSAILFG